MSWLGTFWVDPSNTSTDGVTEGRNINQQVCEQEEWEIPFHIMRFLMKYNLLSGHWNRVRKRKILISNSSTPLPLYDMVWRVGASYPFIFWCTILCYRASLLPKQFVGKGYTVWFAITFPAVVRTGIWNLAMVLVIARWLFTKNTVRCLMSN